VRVAVVGRKALYEIGGQNAAEVHRVGLVTVQFEGIGLAIGPPARGWRGEAIEKVVKRRLTRNIGFENSIVVVVIVEVVGDS
jgi:hypothetical protein